MMTSRDGGRCGRLTSVVSRELWLAMPPRGVGARDARGSFRTAILPGSAVALGAQLLITQLQHEGTQSVFVDTVALAF